jgi:hypothetical protein
VTAWARQPLGPASDGWAGEIHTDCPPRRGSIQGVDSERPGSPGFPNGPGPIDAAHNS